MGSTQQRASDNPGPSRCWPTDAEGLEDEGGGGGRGGGRAGRLSHRDAHAPVLNLDGVPVLNLDGV
jgi:hypothetical protein